jgi:DNA-binding beta-propeller fold protein YncE
VTYTGQSSHVSGRVTSLAVDPDGRTVYVGSSGGGIWKTTDITAAKPGWTAVGDALPPGRSGP